MSHVNSEIVFTVVSNDEGQYSIWPSDKPLPAGWREAGKRGPKQACLNFIAQEWTDLRPASLRSVMENTAHQSASQ